MKVMFVNLLLLFIKYSAPILSRVESECTFYSLHEKSSFSFKLLFSFIIDLSTDEAPV
ncbi:hypothetical protein CHCC14817_3088 [Bacillus paralicheniformis]|nr:hypothetical protein CHCC5022_1819 [Bacillus paralicheniformis]TWJ58164.1 hypothetical protein CHCC5021_4375 [Bacillus paralicheniformis]TWM01171.1 hypothetical protein CHCC15136_4523 [Bacillus paralicheniformis]TWM42058.1 hypothetical protein CHCC14817_3088 [Bacillus paralicheniformis]